MHTPEHPRRMINEAIRERSLSKLVTALEAARANSPSKTSFQQLLPLVLAQCVRLGDVDMVEYLMQHEKAPITSLSPLTISASPSTNLLELLLAYGWDVNQAEGRGPHGQARKLIDLVCNNAQLVRWLAEHGARVTDGEMEGYEVFPQPAPLLETCAARGSISTFQYLRERGALLGMRTLHRAVGEAAAMGTDPFVDGLQGNDGKEESQVRRSERAEMLRFLVEELKLDINAMDSDVPDRAYHWGTPLFYAAVEDKGAPVVNWLLQKGARPTVDSLRGDADAERLATSLGCEENAQALRRWKQRANE